MVVITLVVIILPKSKLTDKIEISVSLAKIGLAKKN